MDKKIVYAVIVGVALFALGMTLRIFANQEGPQIILFFITFLVVGLIATGVKRGLLLSFVLSLILSFASNAILSPQVFDDINVVMALLVFSLIASLMCAALGAVGGLVGKRIFK